MTERVQRRERKDAGAVRIRGKDEVHRIAADQLGRGDRDRLRTGENLLYLLLPEGFPALGALARRPQLWSGIRRNGAVLPIDDDLGALGHLDTLGDD